MILTKSKPFNKNELKQLRELFDTYFKTVIDVERKICSAGMDRHFEGEKILLDMSSKQSNIWGGGIDIESQAIDFNSFINIRPNDNKRNQNFSSTSYNNSSEILNPQIREEYKKLTKYFFKEIL